MKILTLITACFLMVGCSSVEYEKYVEAQREIAVAQAQAESERYKAMASIAANGTEVSKVAAMFALQSGKYNISTNNTAPPKSSWDSAKEWASILVPGAVQAYSINANKGISITQSNNARDTALSTNQAFVSMAGKIQGNTSNVLSGTGVLGSGTYSYALSNDLSGTGVLGSGTYNTTDSHSSTSPPTVVPGLVCTVDSTGNLVCN